MTADNDSSPYGAAFAWIEHLKADDLRGVWSGLHRDFRTAIAQRWVIEEGLGHLSDNAAVNAIVDEMGAPAPDPEVWLDGVDFVRAFFGVIAKTARDEELGAGARPRPVAPGLEMIRLFVMADLQEDEHGNRVFGVGQWARSISLVMSHSDEGWLVAGVGEGVYRPGWPPVFQQLTEPTD